MLEFKVYNIANQTQPIRGGLSLTPGSCLTRFGFSEEGQLSSYDPMGVLRVFNNQFGGSWVPRFRDKEPNVKGNKAKKNIIGTWFILLLDATHLLLNTNFR
ncbi:protein ENHANCER OF LHP1 1-like isoform X2 [Rutidosis leptorrhynchoides]